MNLIGKRVMTYDGHIGVVIKQFKPTGRDMTVHIKQDDGRIWYCPDYHIIEIEEEINGRIRKKKNRKLHK